jgi:putative ABC transport system permease protein
MPDWKDEITKRLRTLKLAPTREAEITEELAQHLEDRYKELVTGGAAEDEARRAALEELSDHELLGRELRSVEQSVNQELAVLGGGNKGNLLTDFVQDLRHGLRVLAKNRGFTVAAIMTLTLGIGSSTTVFTMVNTLLLHPLPVKDPSHLVALYTTHGKGSEQSGNLLPTSYLNLKDYASNNAVFSSLTGYSGPLVMTLAGKSGPQRVFGELVTSGYFKTLALHPAKGRFFLPSEVATSGNAPVAVLSYGAWQGKFGGSPDVIGRNLEINQTTFTVVGVAPKGFIGVSAVFGPDVFLPATMAEQVLTAELPDVLRERAKPFFHGVARLKPGVTRGQAEADMKTIAVALQREYPEADQGQMISVQALSTELFAGMGGEASVAFGSAGLLVIVGLVLLIACSNVANLLLARTASRRQEISVRLAIGASRRRIVRQLLAESLLLGLMAGVAGFALGYAGCQLLWSNRPAEVAQNLVDFRLDTTVFAFTFLVSLATGLIFGVVPAIRASKTDVLAGLQEGTRMVGLGGREVTLGKALIAGQMAFSLVALITAALFLRSVQHAYQIDPGFDSQHLAVFMMNPGQAGYDKSRTEAFYRDARNHVRALPGIAQASWASNMPFWSNPSRGISVQGREQQSKAETLLSIVNTVSVDYFDTMRIPILGGRVFSDQDGDGSRPVALVNEDLARKYWPKGDAVGSLVQLSGDRVVRQVVGVVKTTNYTGLGEPPQPCLYLPLLQNFSDGMTLYVRAASDPASILDAVQREIHNDAPQLAVSDVRTGAKIISQVLFNQQLGVELLGVFGFLALALASVGLYGIMAYSVNQRRREIGLRVALGASQPSVIRLILRQGMALVMSGVVLGLGLSLLLGRVLSRRLYGVGASDPLSLAGASLVLLAVAMVACYLPAYRASRVDPMVALRCG